MMIVRNRITKIKQPLLYMSQLAFQLCPGCLIVSSEPAHGKHISRINDLKTFLIYYSTPKDRAIDFGRLKKLESLKVPMTVSFDWSRGIRDEYGVMHAPIRLDF